MPEPAHIAIDLRPGRIVLATVWCNRVLDTRRLELQGAPIAAEVAEAIAILRQRAPAIVQTLGGVWRPLARLGIADPAAFVAFLGEVGARTALPTRWLPHGAALALGEWLRAPTDGPLAAIALDVGLAGGVVRDGQLFAPLQLDVGHLSVQPDGLKCACGARGCLHAYASETAVQELARDLGSSLEQPSAADWQQVMGSHLAALQAEKARSTQLLTERAGGAIGLAAARLADSLGVVEVRVRARHPDHWRVLEGAAQRALADVAGPRAPRLVAAAASEDAFWIGATAPPA